MRDILGALFIGLNGLAAVRWAVALARTRDKPPEWQPPRMWPLRLRRDGYRRLLAVEVAVFAVIFTVGTWLLVTEPTNRVDPFAPDSYWPVGTCLQADGVAGFGNASCTGPHTHVVVARLPTEAACPPGTDADVETPANTFCLKEDADLHPDVP